METQETSPKHGNLTHDHGPTDVSNPLSGVVLCCTSVPAEKRTKLAEQAQQMGALHKYDLTSEVTHLIVGDYDTPKYRYVAKERPDVKVLTVDWVEAVRELWIADRPIDVDALEKEHQVPTFATLKICLTGFEDPTERAGIAELVSSHGAQYRGDLTKAVTHLIASRPEGSKYKHAKMWGLRTVSLEWVTDSIERGMILDENLYSPEVPVEQRGKDAWRRVVKSPLGKRRHEAIAALDDGKRKLRRTTSTKLTSQNEKIWGDIVGGASVIQAAASGVWETAEDFQNDKNDSARVAKRTPSNDPIDVAPVPVNAVTRRTFSDCRFYIDGFDEKKFQVLQSHLTSHDGEITMTPADFVAPTRKSLFLLVPHSVPETKLPDLPDCDTHIQTVTEWWVERCLGVKAFVDPSEYTFGRPFPKYPIPRFSDVTVCSTGFEGTQLLHLSKAVALVGATYDEFFSRKASVLIVNPDRATRREKLMTARECGIPLVSLDWLLDSIESGTRQRFQPYLQRSKRPKLDIGIVPVVDEDLARPQRQEKAVMKPDLEDSSSQSRSSKEAPKAPKPSKLDDTAFQDEPPPPINPKPESPNATFSTTTTEPLTAISPNSPRKPPSPTKSNDSSPPIPPEAINTMFTSLLAATKPKDQLSENAKAPSASEARKKRAPTRILGRAASIASNSGTSFSRASSVDSTASTGAAVIWPNKANNNIADRNPGRSDSPADQLSNPSMGMNMFMTNGGDEDSQPPQTQMQYDDVESSEYKARVMAKMTGEKVVRREVARVATVASLKETARGARKTRLRDRMGGAGAGTGGLR